MILAVGFENRRQGLKERIRETYDRATTAAWTGEGVMWTRAAEPGRGQKVDRSRYILRLSEWAEVCKVQPKIKKERSKAKRNMIQKGVLSL